MNNLLINMIEDRIKQLEEDTKLCIDERLAWRKRYAADVLKSVVKEYYAEIDQMLDRMEETLL